MDAATRQRHLDEIAEQGYTVIADAFDAAMGDEMLASLARLEGDFGTNDFEGHHTKRVYNLLAYDPIWQQVPVHDQVLPVVEGVLDRGCLVSSLSSIAIHPGETPQPIHSDDILMPVPKPHVAFVCNTMWALTDFTEANGATRVVPGSHLGGEVDYGAPIDTVPAEMPAGSVLVWHGSLWHGGGANTSDQVRVGVAMNYCAGFIRQQENQLLGIPRPLARTFSPRLRELIGYSLYSALIGHIDRHHPAEFLDLDDDAVAAGSSLVWDQG